MKLVFTRSAWSDHQAWTAIDERAASRLNALINDAMRHPFTGVGKPEPLRGHLAGWWSRRITGEHRFVYRVSGKAEGQALEVASCRYHYKQE